jgi:prepilin-type N-terminal cleavage/methylation domain-containing protein/prepilin-type processing-associated H-X9-DG protein
MSKARAFTLVELLVVIGIVALLVAMLMPALSKARASAVSVQCQSNLRQLFLAQNFYADDHGGQFTPVQYVVHPLLPPDWMELLTQYIGNPADARGVFHCPAVDVIEERQRTYGLNSHLMMPNWQRRRDRTVDMTKLIIFADKGASAEDFVRSEDKFHLLYDQVENNWFWVQNPFHSNQGSYRHGRDGSVNAVMGDGHVRRLDREEQKRDSGHWYWGTHEFNQWTLPDPNCCQ